MFVSTRQFVHGVYRTHSKGPDRHKAYAVEQVASFLVDSVRQQRKKALNEGGESQVDGAVDGLRQRARAKA